MPVYFFWGDDDFRLKQAVEVLRDRVLDPTWASFNYDKIPADSANATVTALNQAMTPPFGQGKRLIWLQDTSLAQRCPEATLKELERTLPAILESSVLLLTSAGKLDGRLKATKLIQKHAEVREFSTLPPWKTDEITRQVHQIAQEVGLKLRPQTAALLTASVGPDTRRLYGELEKLRLYWQSDAPLPPEPVSRLVTTTTQTSLQLAEALRQGQTDQALELAYGLLGQNESALKVVAALVGQFRTWLWVKVMLAAGERDYQAIAQAAEVGNPKRVHFLQQAVRKLSVEQLRSALGHLLDLESSLKLGASERVVVPTKIVEIAHCFAPG